MLMLVLIEVSDTPGATHPSDVRLPLNVDVDRKRTQPKSSVAQTEPGAGAYM